MSEESTKKKVFVGLSGGVDSSVSAALLKEAGFDVVGVFIKVWQPPFLECVWKDDRRDAMRVAAKLDIPFITIDLGEEYKQDVAEYMIEEYKIGRTPNPDVMCNKRIKFGAFFEKAMDMGADFVATGHYAKNLDNKLYKGEDDNKDQSYFLWTMPKEKLTKVKFPIGHLKKEEVRKVALKYDLITADKKDSQGLCFLGKLDMKDFLKNFIPEKEGNVLNEKGEVVGKHDGAFYYTLGQRHGFTITQKGTDDKPLYVVAKDIDENTITVSENPLGESPRDEIRLSGVNWINEPKENEPLEARARYRAPLEKCKIIKRGESVEVKFEKPGIFPVGQSLVIYRGDECLGGGVIE